MSEECSTNSELLPIVIGSAEQGSGYSFSPQSLKGATFHQALAHQERGYTSGGRDTRRGQRLHKTLPLHLRYLSSPIIFLDHHNNHLTHFPLEEVRDKPDIVGVVGSAHDFVRANGHSDYKSIPYHRVETFVEAKATRKDGRAQAASYAWQHLQARPDHPGVYCLSVKPETYQVLWSDPSGVVASPHTSWKELQLLAAFLYSLYMPPLSHFVRDRSIVWTEPPGQVFGPPRWTITSQGVKYRDCSILFNGKAWGNRTTVFSSPATESSGFAIIKESYTDNASRFQEADILQHIHSDGLMPGVVRLVDSENVQVDEQAIGTSARCDATRRTKTRLIMGSRGTRLENARSIADLLKAIYDALEVHRNVAIGHDILNRTSGEGVDHSRCILIDWDNAMMLDEDQYLGCKDLAHRMVTRAAPAKMLGSRSNARTFKGMPELTGEALTRYVEAHGYTRYEAYNGLSSRPPSLFSQYYVISTLEDLLMNNIHPELQTLRTQLRDIYGAMSSYEPSIAKPPILDSSIDLSGDVNEDAHNRQESVQGLRALRDSVRRDLDVLEKFLADPACASLPALSTNAPYLISVWNEVLHASPPVTTIWRTFFQNDLQSSPRRRGFRKPSGVKVDVIAEGGKRWIRVNTTKNSRMLAEFREIDSYLTGSEEESPEEEDHPSLAQTEFDNSLLRIGRSLLSAADRNPVPGTSIAPSITLRLTRLDPSPPDQKDHDPRIAKTICELQKMGIDVELGERDAPPAMPPMRSPARGLEPTRHVNLDLSILIALVSDITHSPLPKSAEEADARFTPSIQQREWKQKRLEETNRSFDDNRTSDEGLWKHSRALANQALQEMGKGLLQELHDRLAQVSPDGLRGIEFWTTAEARDRCLRIVLSKIGGPNEKRRAEALFPSSDTPSAVVEEAYWRGSRYPQGFLPLLPIRILPSSVPGEEVEPPVVSDDGRSLSPFFKVLARTCRAILSQEIIPHPRTAVDEKEKLAGSSGSANGNERQVEDDDEEIERAAVTKASPRLTAHTVKSLLWGATQGWTTLTANKASVKAILRHMRSAEGGYGWDNDEDAAAQLSWDDHTIEKATLWVVDPRSLAEGMRSEVGH
ncbi:hypothetical protein A0H81_03223 [Grifola frondosa]|uniref:Uncharacterized protein n=1 Tax=Grifola frondosa TaxID=5627 RepID=A0A1C7MJB5_GRIFR|nr:hypothetical protein A0H81_03223 [Grifola frondosa]